MPGKRRVDVHPALQIDEQPRLSAGVSPAELREKVSSVLQQVYSLGEDLKESRGATGTAVYDARRILLALAERVEKARSLAALAARKAEQDGLPAKWVDRIERFAQSMEKLAEEVGLTVHIPAGHPQPGIDDVVQEVDSDDVPRGEIVEVLTEGWLWRGEVLRCSEVTVAR